MNKLKAKIRELEILQLQQEEELRLSFRELSHSLSPSNLVKTAFKSVISSPGLRSTAIDTALSAGAGLLGKKMLVRGSGNIFRKMAGTAVQFILTNFVRNKMPEIKEKIHAGTNGVDHS
ncbi:MAG: hypothetical protein ABIR30_04075 [Chitinophagaceae bacterium]